MVVGKSLGRCSGLAFHSPDDAVSVQIDPCHFGDIGVVQALSKFLACDLSDAGYLRRVNA